MGSEKEVCMKKIVIVHDGFVPFLDEGLSAEVSRALRDDDENFSIHEVPSLEQARELVRSSGVAILIFTTADLVHEAARIRQYYPKTRVVVLATEIPDDELVILKKEWLTPTLLRDVLAC